ncbi:MAG: ABC transporter permease [Erysipelothrix sp.]|nr:ABC transporter permease [Erysipelothrix sp.]
MSKKIGKNRRKNKLNDNQELVESPFKIYLDRFKRNKLAMVGLYLTLFIVSLIVLAWLYVTITGYNLAALDYSASNLPPSLKYPFGTDKDGRSYFIRVLYGGVISLQVGLIATFVSTLLGVFFGGVAGYYGGKVDAIIMRLAEMVSSLPLLPLAITVQATFSHLTRETRFMIMIMFIGFTGWTGLARMIRAQILSLREQEFMLAAKAMGIKPAEQIGRHLIPNVIAHVILSAVSSFAGAIMVEATLSFLGLSVQEPTPTWGRLLNLAKTATIMKNQWWLWVFPGIILVSLIIGVNLIGEGLNDAVDPKSNVKFNRAEDKRNFFRFKRKAEEVTSQ